MSAFLVRRGHSEAYLQRLSVAELQALRTEHAARDAEDRYFRNEDRVHGNHIERRAQVGNWEQGDPDGPAWSERPYLEHQQQLFAQAWPELATPEGRAWLAWHQEEMQFERDARAIEELN